MEVGGTTCFRFGNVFSATEWKEEEENKKTGESKGKRNKSESSIVWEGTDERMRVGEWLFFFWARCASEKKETKNILVEIVWGKERSCWDFYARVGCHDGQCGSREWFLWGGEEYVCKLTILVFCLYFWIKRSKEREKDTTGGGDIYLFIYFTFTGGGSMMIFSPGDRLWSGFFFHNFFVPVY